MLLVADSNKNTDDYFEVFKHGYRGAQFPAHGLRAIAVNDLPSVLDHRRHVFLHGWMWRGRLFASPQRRLQAVRRFGWRKALSR